MWNSDDKAGTDSGTESTKSVGESLDYKITGIDPGAGIMEATEKAIAEYGLEITTYNRFRCSNDGSFEKSL